MDERIILIAAGVFIAFFAFPVQTSPLPGKFQVKNGKYVDRYPCSRHLFPSALLTSSVLDIESYAESIDELQLLKTKFVESDDNHNNCAIEVVTELPHYPIPHFVMGPRDTAGDFQHADKSSSELRKYGGAPSSAPGEAEEKSSEVMSEAGREDTQAAATSLVEFFKVMADSYLPTEDKMSEGATDLKPVEILAVVRNPFKGNLIVKTAALDSFLSLE